MQIPSKTHKNLHKKSRNPTISPPQTPPDQKVDESWEHGAHRLWSAAEHADFTEKVGMKRPEKCRNLRSCEFHVDLMFFFSGILMIFNGI